MSKEYKKKCSNCGTEIIMSLTDSGKWQPMETDNATIHRCMQMTKKTPTSKYDNPTPIPIERERMTAILEAINRVLREFGISEHTRLIGIPPSRDSENQPIDYFVHVGSSDPEQPALLTYTTLHEIECELSKIGITLVAITPVHGTDKQLRLWMCVKSDYED